MKKSMIVAAMLAMVATGASAKNAADSAAIAKNKPVFTVVKQNPITSIKDQNRSGTCWAYSTLSFFERDFEEHRQDIQPERDVRCQQDLYGSRHNGCENARRRKLLSGW